MCDKCNKRGAVYEIELADVLNNPQQDEMWNWCQECVSDYFINQAKTIVSVHNLTCEGVCAG